MAQIQHVISRLKLALLLIFGLIQATRALPPEEALQKMKVADGFTARLVACEPNIRQPLSITFDDRGRMWVIQYLQYPTPAGLKPVKVDQYLRTTYDKLPEPPPRGPKGVDRITICEDTDGDGRMDKFKDFVTGLNLCSGLALGYDGAFVVQSPYLLFYPDRNHDDIPDGDPEVLLTGFGMEDAHAFANSLTWGPDGWLYGAQGSTVTAHIRGIEFQQGVWRYHPRTHAFELFAEGGGNTWGVDFDDDDGEIFAGTNYYEKMLHIVQGGYYIKNFGKHGELHNPHAYGYFDHVPYSGYKGLHISIGGIVYHGGAFPPSFNGSYIFGNTLDHAVYWANLKRNGSTFTASFGGALLKTDDELFRPVDCTVGPDGAVYIADWCDKRATHVDPLDTWDRSNGRIYKVEPAQPTVSKPQPFDLSKLAKAQLVDLLGHSNQWFARGALRLLNERKPSRVSNLKLPNHNDPNALKYLWATHAIGGFNDKVARAMLHHPDAQVRKWTVRLLCDAKERPLKKAIANELLELAHNETSAPVRSQLAASAKRLPTSQCLPIVHELVTHDEDADDPFVPLLLWWAIEENAKEREQIIRTLLVDPTDWNRPVMTKHLLERIARRFAADGNEQGFTACAKLLQAAPSAENGAISPNVEKLLRGIEKALTGKTFSTMPNALQRWFEQAWQNNNQNLSLIRFGSRFGNEEAQKAAVTRIQDQKSPEDQRVELIDILGQTGNSSFEPLFFEILESSGSETLRIAAVGALQRHPNEEIARKLLALYPKTSGNVRAQLRSTLASRPGWATLLIEAVEQKQIQAKEIPIEQVRQIASYKNDSLNTRLQKLWGKIQADSPAEKQNTINELKLVLKPSGAAGRDAKGNPVEGKKLFQQTCAVCHKLFDEGNAIGPDLTGVDRKNTEFMLQNIVNPSGYIRSEFVSFEVETKDEQTFGGLIVESGANAVTIVDRNNQRHTIGRDSIKEIKESQLSLMPEGLLEALQPQQILDLFSYLQKD